MWVLIKSDKHFICFLLCKTMFTRTSVQANGVYGYYYYYNPYQNIFQLTFTFWPCNWRFCSVDVFTHARFYFVKLYFFWKSTFKNWEIIFTFNRIYFMISFYKTLKQIKSKKSQTKETKQKQSKRKTKQIKQNNNKKWQE